VDALRRGQSAELSTGSDDGPAQSSGTSEHSQEDTSDQQARSADPRRRPTAPPEKAAYRERAVMEPVLAPSVTLADPTRYSSNA
jgi:hypothetical protein